MFSEDSEADEGHLTLAQIDRLIDDEENRDYAAALDALNGYFSSHPEEFDAVQKRIDKIFKSREQYSSYVSSLIDVIKNGREGNEAELKELTDRLIQMERNPGDKRLDVIKDTNYLVSMYQYSAVQNATKELFLQEKYDEAASKAVEGFGALHENFARRYSGESVVQEADRLIERAKAAGEQYKLIQSRLKDAVKAYEKSVKGGNEPQIDASLSEVRAVFIDFAKIRNEINDIGIQIQNLTAAQKKSVGRQKKGSSADEDIFLKHGEEFLSLALGTVYGWQENFSPEKGILGVMDGQWNLYTERMKKTTADAINKIAQEFSEKNSVEEFKEKGTLPDKRLLAKIRRYAVYGKAVNGLYSLLRTPDGKDFMAAKPNYNISVDYIDGLAAITEQRVEKVLEVDSYRRAADALSAGKNPSAAELGGSTYASDLIRYASSVENVMQELSGGSSKNANWGRLYKAAVAEYSAKAAEQKDPSLAVPERIPGRPSAEKKKAPPMLGVQLADEPILWSGIEKTSENYELAMDDIFRGVAVAIYVKAADHYAACGTEYVRRAQDDSREINLLLNGDSESGSTRHYSQKAVVRTGELTTFIANAKAALSGGQAKIASAYADEYRSQSASIADSIEKLSGIVIDSRAFLVVAEKLIKRSENNRRKGDESMRDSRRSLQRENFDRATDQAYKASDYYMEALRDNYDEEFSQKSSADVTKLLTDIKERQKVFIFDEVDSLIAKANDEYRNDNYSEAQSYLMRAQERWNVVFPEIENGEISGLNSIIDIALQANNGRYPTDKVAEIAQILSIANQLFNKKEYAKALTKLDELRAIAPKNKDANILRLRIQQIQNPEQFASRFKARVEQARLDYKNKDKQLEAYSDLRDLAEINPSYPGLKDLILEVEYEIGIKVRVTDTGKSDSAKLLAEARVLFNQAGSNQELLKQAMAKADQAIAKYSGNSEAKSLKNRIRVKLESQVVNITFEVNEKYQEAMEKYNAFDYAGANEIIEKIWADSRNHTDKIDKLRKRIKAELI